MKNITLSRTCTLNILYDVSKKRAILNYTDSYVSKDRALLTIQHNEFNVLIEINIFW